MTVGVTSKAKKSTSHLGAASSRGASSGSSCSSIGRCRSDVVALLLMERDTWSRLKSDPEATRKMAHEYFLAADKDKDGVVNYGEYKEWALANPQVLSFFAQVQKAVSGMVKSTGPGAPMLDVTTGQ